MASQDQDRPPEDPPRGAGLEPGAPSDGPDPAAAGEDDDDPSKLNEYAEALRRQGDGPKVS